MPEANNGAANAAPNANTGAANASDAGASHQYTQDEIKSLIGSSINAAITAREQRLEERLAKRFEDLLGKGSQRPETSQQQTTQTAQQGQQSPEVVQMRERLDQMERELKESRKREQQERERLMHTNVRSEIYESLRAAKVPEQFIPVIHSHLTQTSFAVSEAGEPRLRVKRSRVRGEAAEEAAFPVRDGIADWLKTDEAKAFLPAPVTAPPPTGRRPGVPPAAPANGSSNSGPRTLEEAVAAAAAQLDSQQG